MAEVAERGGCVLIDPLDIDALEREMSRLLDDDQALDELRQEIVADPSRSWAEYADEVWSFFTGEQTT